MICIAKRNPHFNGPKRFDRDRTRTCNPQIRSLVPYPLGHTTYGSNLVSNPHACIAGQTEIRVEGKFLSKHYQLEGLILQTVINYRA